MTEFDVCVPRYTGKERDAESGLDNFGARYLGSSMGRFMSPDPGQASGFDHMNDPQAWNGYAYGRNNPLIYTDPDGENYHICDSGGQNCSDVSDKDFDQIQKDARAAGEHWSNGSISLADGTAGGSYKQTDVDLPGDPVANQAAANMIGNGGMSAIKTFVVGSVVGGTIGAAGLAYSGAMAVTVPTIMAPLLPVMPSAIDKLQKIGVSIQEANQIVNSPASQKLVDNLNNGNINYVQDIGGKLVRITTDPTGQRIISAGTMRANQITNGLKGGRFQ
jgi:RHS repeat-associated protein